MAHNAGKAPAVSLWKRFWRYTFHPHNVPITLALLPICAAGGVLGKLGNHHHSHHAEFMKFLHNQMREECKAAEVDEATMKILDAEIETTFKKGSPPDFAEYKKLSHEEKIKKLKEHKSKKWNEMKEKVYEKITDEEQRNRLKVCLAAHEQRMTVILSKGHAVGYYLAFSRAAADTGLAKKTLEDIHTMMEKQKFGHFSVMKKPCDLNDADKKKIIEELDAQIKKLREDATATLKDEHLSTFFDKATQIIKAHQEHVHSYKCKEGKVKFEEN